jgi:glycosyltransferase involved in cell wall biosynthesis
MTPTRSSSRDRLVVAHLTTVDLSLRFLLWPQLLAVVESGSEAYGISSAGPWVVELEEAGVRHVELRSSTRGVSLLSDIRASIEFWREIRKLPVTVLHTHNPKPGIYGRILGRLAGVPVVVNTLHGFYATETDRLLKRLVVYGLEMLAARFSDAELHQNVEDLELARRLHIVRRSRSRLLGNGIDLARFDPAGVDLATRNRLRAELGATDNQVVVGTVGRLVAEKGFPELFEAVEQLGDDYVVAIIGPVDPDKPDALPADMIERAERAGVRFLGMRKDMEDLYSAMDLFILPSHREGFPRAAMEAAAMGLPVVATDIRGCRQVVRHGINGLLIPVRDPTAIREAIQALGEDPATRAAMSRASRDIAIDEFDEKKVVAIVIDTYCEALAAKGLGHLIPGSWGNSGIRT